MSVYKGENVIAGGSVDTYFVRKPAWSQAVAVTAADISAGYTVPKDGIMIIPYFQTNSGVSGFKRVHINGTVTVASAFGDGAGTRPSSAQITVNAGDVITADSGSSISDAATFVPFEDSTIAEPEVVTPEYIRNQNILSDYEAVTANTEFTAQYDGEIDGYTSGTGQASISINGVGISYAQATANSEEVSLHATFKKGDVVSSVNIAGGALKARYYKLRDYRGR